VFELDAEGSGRSPEMVLRQRRQFEPGIVRLAFEETEEIEDHVFRCVNECNRADGSREREYYNTLRRLQVCIIHGTYVEDGPLLDEGIPSDEEEYFEKWRARLAREYVTKCKALPDSIVWKKLWNACFAARIDPRNLDGKTMFNLFRSLLEQVSSIDNPKTAPEDSLSSVDPNDGDGPRGKTDIGLEVEIND
jgi:hypothetical protein